MLVLGIGDTRAGALVVNGAAQDDDATLLSCFERVSYMKVFSSTATFLFYLSYSLIF
jgi:hypothetical protein